VPHSAAAGRLLAGVQCAESRTGHQAARNRFSGNWLELQVGADLAKANRVVPMP